MSHIKQTQIACEGVLGYYEFFAGGGMARLGLGRDWKCLFANDFDPKKAEAYRQNFQPSEELVVADVRLVSPDQLPARASLAWASFPCQDLSLAGIGTGLSGERSGTFWPFLNLMIDLKSQGRNPPVIVLENVAGLVTSHDGTDLVNLAMALINTGYRVGMFLIDAAMFVAQSRPRLFIIAVAADIDLPAELVAVGPDSTWHSESLLKIYDKLSAFGKSRWLWLSLPAPDNTPPAIGDIVEEFPQDVSWHSDGETQRLLSMMTEANAAKVRQAIQSKKRVVGTIYKRTRKGVQRAEVRFDGVSGCLRTPSGGSSRQIIIFVDKGLVRTRLISARETARLMGLPDSYALPKKYNDAYHLTGDGVVVPVVSWLERHIVRPIVQSSHCTNKHFAVRDKEPQLA